MNPQKIIVSKLFSDEEMLLKKGTWITENDIHHPIISNDTDVYWLDNDNHEHLLLKFRKNVIHDDLIQLGWDSYKDLAKASRGRGASAGPIDANSDYWKKRTLKHTNKWSTGYLSPKGNQMKKELDLLELSTLQNMIQQHTIPYSDEEFNDKDHLVFLLIQHQGGVSKMKVNNQVASNPIGFYESSKNLGADLPCRLTHFTRTNFEKYNEGLPFIQKINSLFHELIPDAHQKQSQRANLKPHLTIPDTCFSTITINRNFRTAIHQDAGDFKDGFGNLTVIEEGYYHGGYTVFPQFGVAIDLRTNDFVAMDVHQWHANTPFYETNEDILLNQDIISSFNDNPDVGTAGLYKQYTRISFVCYLREKIANCANQEDIDPQFLTKSGHDRIKSE